MKMENGTIGIIEIIFASLLFGLLPVVVRFGENLGPYNLSFFRIMVAAISIYIFILFSNKQSLMPFKFEKGKLLLFGAIHGFTILGYFLAIQYLTIATAALLLYSGSIWMVVFSYLLLKEKISRRNLFALAIAFLGVWLVIPPKNFFLRESLIGLLSGLGAGIGMGLVYTMSKTFKKYGKVSLTFWQNVIALPFCLPLILIEPPNFMPIDFGIVMLLGSVFTAIPFILTYKGLGRIDAQEGGVVIMLSPVSSVFFAWLILEEIPTGLAILGGILILVGTFIILTKKRREFGSFFLPIFPENFRQKEASPEDFRTPPETLRYHR